MPEFIRQSSAIVLARLQKPSFLGCFVTGSANTHSDDRVDGIACECAVSVEQTSMFSPRTQLHAQKGNSF